MYDVAIPILAALVIVCLVLHFSPHGLRLIQQAGLRRRCREQKAIVLSYDDGPSATTTPDLLQVLAQAGKRANFFLLGRRAGNEPRLSSLVAAGHEIGSHGHDHVNAWFSSPLRAFADVEQGAKTLGERLGRRAWFRPPYGKLSAASFLAARRRGFRFAWWTLDSGDTWPELPSVSSVVDRVRGEGGAVVLMHDHHEDAGRREFVLELTGTLFALQQDGFQFKTLDEIYEAAS